MNPWPYVLGAYLLAAAGLLWYLLSLRRRRQVLVAKLALLRRTVRDSEA
jgi:type VI protein secretion system component VasF